MENNPFDTLFSSSNLQMLKVLFPLLPPENRGFMAILIRVLELRQTIQYIRHCPGGRITGLSPMPEGEALLEQLLPFCSEAQRKEMTQLRQTMQQMKQMQDMMAMANEMKDLFSDGQDGQAMDPTQLFGLFSNSLVSDNPSSASSQAVENASSREPDHTEDTTIPTENAYPAFPHFYDKYDATEEKPSNQMENEVLKHGTMDD